MRVRGILVDGNRLLDVLFNLMLRQESVGHSLAGNVKLRWAFLAREPTELGGAIDASNSKTKDANKLCGVALFISIRRPVQM
jgi:hypothetical protein